MPFRSVNTVERVETDDGEFLKATGVLAKEGVYQYPRANSDRPHRELLPGEALDESSDAWDHIPVALDHPVDEDGIATVFDAGVEEPPIIGDIRNPAAQDEKETELKGEAWFDLSQSGDHDGHFDAIIDALENDETVETSAAYRANRANESGMFHGERYDSVQRPLLPDHVAVFSPGSGKTGNCSVEAGCGVGRANEDWGTPLEGSDYVDGLDDVDDDTAASIGRRVLDAVGLGGLFGRANGEEQHSDGSAESDTGSDDSTMKDSEKINYLVDEHGLDEENIEPLEGEECLDTIYSKFEGEDASDDGDEGDNDNDPPTASGSGGGDEMEAVANQLTELSEEISAVKDQLNERSREKQRLAAEQIAAQTGVDPEAVTISADAAEEMIATPGRANMAGVGGVAPRANSGGDTEEYVRARQGNDRFGGSD